MQTLTKDQVEKILRNPHNREWSLQGLGMLRTYLDDGKVQRLHVWSNPHKTPNVSTLHDHPWDFESLTYAGCITDVEYVEVPAWDLGSRKWNYQQIICGPDGCATSPVQEIYLRQCPPCAYPEGEGYFHHATDIHASYPIDGTVTIITRKGDTEKARVFWEPDRSWGSARPRPATREEVDQIVGVALRNWF